MNPKRAGLYVRVSTEDQRTDLQERQLTEYVKRRRWKLHKIYLRDKISGATVSRPGLDDLLKDCRRAMLR
jgi:DNA invertase Pin-like site-specific DNA recombinase